MDCDASANLRSETAAASSCRFHDARSDSEETQSSRFLSPFKCEVLVGFLGFFFFSRKEKKKRELLYALGVCNKTIKNTRNCLKQRKKKNTDEVIKLQSGHYKG